MGSVKRTRRKALSPSACESVIAWMSTGLMSVMARRPSRTWLAISRSTSLK